MQGHGSSLGSSFDLEGEERPSPLHRFLLDEQLAALTSVPKKPPSEAITIYIRCVFPDPQDPGQVQKVQRSKTCNANERVDSVVNDFLVSTPDIPTDNRKYYLGYDQLLFREGTLTECGITHGKAVELYAPGKNAAVNHNEGLLFLLCSIPPIVLGFACFLFSILSKQYSIDAGHWQAMFLFLGFLLLVPGATVLILGLILIPECPMPCYFTGSAWW
jgi:hypothetical protein